jgi:hypothetical protein
VIVARSTDAGRSFTARTEAREPGLVLAQPAAADDGAGGVLLVYYAGRNVIDAPGAVRWAHLAPVNARADMPVIAREVRAPVFLVSAPGARMGEGAASDDPRALGDGLGAAAGDGHLAAAFVDNAEGVSHVAYAELGP